MQTTINKVWLLLKEETYYEKGNVVHFRTKTAFTESLQVVCSDYNNKTNVAICAIETALIQRGIYINNQ